MTARRAPPPGVPPRLGGALATIVSTGPGGFAPVLPEGVAAEQRAERDRLRLRLAAGRQGDRDPPLLGLPAAARAADRPHGRAARAAQDLGLDGGIAAGGADPDRHDERCRQPAASGDLGDLTGLAGRAQRGQRARQRPAQRVVYVLGSRRAGCGPSAPLHTAMTSALGRLIRWEASVTSSVVLTASMLVLRRPLRVEGQAQPVAAAAGPVSEAR